VELRELHLGPIGSLLFRGVVASFAESQCAASSQHRISETARTDLLGEAIWPFLQQLLNGLDELFVRNWRYEFFWWWAMDGNPGDENPVPVEHPTLINVDSVKRFTGADASRGPRACSKVGERGSG
jgi:hypothetical protein